MIHIEEKNCPKYIYKIIGKNIKNYRKRKHWTQEQLAFYSHLSYGYIKNLEAEHVNTSISIETLQYVASVLDVELVQLLEKEKISL